MLQYSMKKSQIQTFLGQLKSYATDTLQIVETNAKFVKLCK